MSQESYIIEILKKSELENVNTAKTLGDVNQDLDNYEESSKVDKTIYIKK